jgi:hypothetical protein
LILHRNSYRFSFRLASSTPTVTSSTGSVLPILFFFDETGQPVAPNLPQ